MFLKKDRGRYKVKYILALDQGTTSSRAVLFDEQQNVVGILSREFEQIYPKEGWVEHDPMDIWASQYGVMMELVAKSGAPLKSVTVTTVSAAQLSASAAGEAKRRRRKTANAFFMPGCLPESRRPHAARLRGRLRCAP